MSDHVNLLGEPPATLLPSLAEADALIASGTDPTEVAAEYPAYALAWAMLRHPGTPRAAKLAVLAAGLYVVSPVDFVSDLVPLLGWIDDGVVAALLLGLAARLMPGELHAALKERIARQQQQQQRGPGGAARR